MRWGISAVVLAVALVAYGIAAPLAAAAPPNDDFAKAEDFGSATLPLEVARSNFGATKEAGEPSPGIGSATGHSVWFRWTAPSSGFVTVGTCEPLGFFPAVLGVYTGAAVNALTEVAGGIDSQGPECAAGEYGATVTFTAVAGTEYEIFVDGYQRFPEEPESVRGQGTFTLTLETPPKPPNDDFAAAAALAVSSPPVGFIQTGYSAGARGYNWGARKEPGEPNHADDPGGASVWYSWTAPDSGTYSFSACGHFPFLATVYAGTALGSLSRVTGKTECGMVLFDASAGTAYRIAVDGRRDPGTGMPAVGSFTLGVYRPAPGPPGERPSRQTPEGRHPKRKSINTILRKRLIDSERRRATFVFGANRKEARFRCQLDRRMPTWCKSPKTYEHLSVGRHSFKVYAVDATSSGDGTPPLARFRIVKGSQRR